MVVITNLYPEVIKVCRPLIVEDEVLRMLVKRFAEGVTKDLCGYQPDTSNVKCNLTYVTDFPNGQEKGSFIGLDFSGRIFRLVYVGLRGDRTCITLSRLYDFPQQKLTDYIGKVVDYVARCVSNFIETYNINEKKTILGVTSSFPLKQECLQDGQILQWGKDFNCKESEKRDFFNLLRVSLRKLRATKGIYLISLINNSTACLMSGLYKDPCVRIGVYLGDDTNVTYLEKFENMPAYTGDGFRPRTAVSVEMKNFGEDGFLDFIRTEFDFVIDDVSPSPGTYVLEKMVSGAYLGEIARLCLVKLTSFGFILRGYLTPELRMKDSLKTADLAMMEADLENKFTRCRAVMNNLGYKVVTDEDCMQIRFVTRCVAKRSANLIAACLTAMIYRMDTRNVNIIADGFLIKEFPNYNNYLCKKMNQLKRPGFKFQLTLGEKDESAIGAGIVALIYKDEVIKAEDKRRALPPANLNKYNLVDLPASVIDCDCETDKTWKRSGSIKAEKNKESSGKKKEQQGLEVSVPVFASVADFSNQIRAST